MYREGWRPAGRSGARAIGRKSFMSVLSVVILCATFVAQVSQASFENLRDDQVVPEHCQQSDIRHFQKSKSIEYFTFGSQGGKKKGFTHEYPVGRWDLRDLYEAIRDLSHSGKGRPPHFKNAHMKRAWATLTEQYAVRGFTMATEGEVLEVLAIDQMEQNLDLEEYFVTGSVAYHRLQKPVLQGELDVVIAKTSNCQVVSVGEVKLGLKSLSKAHRQLDRFRRYLSVENYKVLNDLFTDSGLLFSQKDLW